MTPFVDPVPRWAHDRTCNCLECVNPRSLRKRLVDAAWYAGIGLLLPALAVVWVLVALYELASGGGVSECARGEESR